MSASAPGAAASSALVTADTIAQMSAGELKAYLKRTGTRSDDCLEKSELRARAMETFERRVAEQSSLQELIEMKCLDLLPALRKIDADLERRTTTGTVHAAHLKVWEKSPKWKGMAQHLVKDVHAMFRRGFESLVDPDANPKAARGLVDVPSFQRVNESLHGHHGNEDRAWFPRLRRLHREFDAEIDILEADHARLVALEAAILKGDYKALQEFVAQLSDHLNREELISVPFLMDGTGGL